MSNKLTQEDFTSRLNQWGILHKPLEEYKGSTQKILWQCSVNSGHTWLAPPQSIFAGKSCPHCAPNKKITNEMTDEILKDRNILRNDDCVNTRTKSWWTCTVCQHSWKTKLGTILAGCGCPKCGGTSKLSDEIVDQRLIELNTNIKRLSPYTKTTDPIYWKCLNPGCNHIWLAKPYHIVNDQRGCPLCSSGKSERRCFELIKQNCVFDKIVYQEIVYINGKKQVIDFKLEMKNKIIWIERNGEHHYKPVRYNGITKYKASKNLIRQKQRDKRVYNHCKQNNTCLLEIPYWWKEDKIIEELKKLNSKFNF